MVSIARNEISENNYSQAGEYMTEKLSVRGDNKMIGYCRKTKREVLSEADCVFCKDIDLTCCRYWRDDEESPGTLPGREALSLLEENIPINEWGDKTGLKQTLETHLEYGDDIVRLALISFRQYLKDNFS
jgi:hypothetical protein